MKQRCFAVLAVVLLLAGSAYAQQLSREQLIRINKISAEICEQNKIADPHNVPAGDTLEIYIEGYEAYYDVGDWKRRHQGDAGSPWGLARLIELGKIQPIKVVELKSEPIHVPPPPPVRIVPPPVEVVQQEPEGGSYAWLWSLCLIPLGIGLKAMHTELGNRSPKLGRGKKVLSKGLPMGDPQTAVDVIQGMVMAEFAHLAGSGQSFHHPTSAELRMVGLPVEGTLEPIDEKAGSVLAPVRIGSRRSAVRVAKKDIPAGTTAWESTFQREVAQQRLDNGNPEGRPDAPRPTVVETKKTYHLGFCGNRVHPVTWNEVRDLHEQGLKFVPKHENRNVPATT